MNSLLARAVTGLPWIVRVVLSGALSAAISYGMGLQTLNLFGIWTNNWAAWEDIALVLAVLAAQDVFVYRVKRTVLVAIAFSILCSCGLSLDLAHKPLAALIANWYVFAIAFGACFGNAFLFELCLRDFHVRRGLCSGS